MQRRQTSPARWAIAPGGSARGGNRISGARAPDLGAGRLAGRAGPGRPAAGVLVLLQLLLQVAEHRAPRLSARPPGRSGRTFRAAPGAGGAAGAAGARRWGGGGERDGGGAAADEPAPPGRGPGSPLPPPGHRPLLPPPPPFLIIALMLAC